MPVRPGKGGRMLPADQAEQPLAEWRERGRSGVPLLPVAWVAGESVALAGNPVRATDECAPHAPARCPSRLGASRCTARCARESSEWFGRTPWASSELKIRRSPGSIGTLTIVSPVVSGCMGSRSAGCVRTHSLEVGEELGHALEPAHLVILFQQAEHALHADRQRPHRGVHVPVDEPVRIVVHSSSADSGWRGRS